MSALEDHAEGIYRARVAGGWGDIVRQAAVALADELESLQDDAALGRLVRQMPVGSEFYRDAIEEWRVFYYAGEEGWHYRIGATPEAALEEALGEERDG